MGRPLLFIDFDGVINQFPDPKVMRRTAGNGFWSMIWAAGSRSAGTRSSSPDWMPWMRTNGGCPPGSRRQRN